MSDLVHSTGNSQPVKRGRKSNKAKAEIQPVAVEVQTFKGFTNEQTFALLNQALRKEVADRSELEQAAIDSQSEFTVQLCIAAMKENDRLDQIHNQKMAEIEAMQRKAVEDVQAIFNEAYASHNRMVEAVNTMPPEASRLLAEAFGSNDPNE